MPTIKLLQKTKTKSTAKDATIYVYYYQSPKEKTLLSTGVRCSPKNWNDNSQAVRSSDSQSETKNQTLQIRMKQVMDILNDFAREGEEPSIDKLRTSYNEKISGRKKIKRPLEAIDFMIERKQDLVKNDVIKDYRALKKHLGNFMQAEKLRTVLADVDTSFANHFQQYLTITPLVRFKDKETGEMRERPMAKNTIGKQLKNLKVLMHFAFEEKLIKTVHPIKITPPTEVSDDIALNEADLIALEELNLKEREKEEAIRDWFLLGCELGLRYGDLTRLNAGHLDARKRILSIRTRKSNKNVKVPLSERAKRILKKRNHQFPPQCTYQDFNTRIKEIGREAGIIEFVTKTTTRNGQLEEQRLPRYQLLSSHTCRRTFCTLQFKRGMPTLLIRKVSGHAKETDFLRYIKIDEEEAAEMMLRYWQGIEG